MLLSRLHKIWISFLVIACLAMSGVVSATMMSMPPMMMSSDMNMNSAHTERVNATSSDNLDCHATSTHNMTSSDSQDNQSHCNKLAASDCCPAVCVSVGLLSPSAQFMVRQPHRSKLPSEASVNVITRASSLYRPPIS